MATINLLPWRDELREEQKKEFISVIAVFALVGIAIVLAWKFILDGQISYQESRNQYLKTHIAELDKKVKEIDNLKKQKADLVERMDVIQSLQGDRPVIVYIYDEIVRTLPDGVFYHKIVRKGSQLTLEGTAESNNRVSSLMRQLDSSEWFDGPVLNNVKANDKYGEQANTFFMTVNIVSAQDKDKEE